MSGLAAYNDMKMSTEAKGNNAHCISNSAGLQTAMEMPNSTEHQLSTLVVALRSTPDAGRPDLSISISATFEKLRSEISAVRKENDSLKAKLTCTEMQVVELEDDVEDLNRALASEGENRNEREQDELKESVRFVGVASDDDDYDDDHEEDKSKTDCKEKVLTIIRDKLQLPTVRSEEVLTAQRVGARGVKEPRPILVKFQARRVKTKVLMKRRLLKGTGLGIVENLTPLNKSRLDRVRGHPNVQTCWTKNGRILALLSSGRTVLVKMGDMSVLSGGGSCRGQEPSGGVRSGGRRSSGSSSSSSGSASDSPSSASRATEKRSHPDTSPVASSHSNNRSRSEEASDHRPLPDQSPIFNPRNNRARPPRGAPRSAVHVTNTQRHPRPPTSQRPRGASHTPLRPAQRDGRRPQWTQRPRFRWTERRPSTGSRYRQHGAEGGHQAGRAGHGSRAEGSRAGGSSAGSSSAGGSRAGGSSAGGSSAGGSRAGGSRAGGSSAGGSRAGGSSAGGSRQAEPRTALELGASTALAPAEPWGLAQ